MSALDTDSIAAALHRMTAPPAAATEFGYDAVQATGRRKLPLARTVSEDDELRPFERRILATGTRDLQRNFSIAAWAIRKHLDYVASFAFQCRTGVGELDDRIEALMKWWTRPVNCDASKRFSLRRLVRMAEGRRTVDGDVGILQRKDGKLQIIEGDRICTPADMAPEQIPGGRTAVDFVNGVLLDKDGAFSHFAVCRRARPLGGLTFERLVPAAFMALHTYQERYDQVRGISPIAAAVNTFRDVYENFEYALARSKVEQLFGLKFKRNPVGGDDPMGTGSETTTTDASGEEVGTAYSVDFGKGPFTLDLDPGDDADFLQSENPSNQFQAFTQAMLMAALKALDLPLSFYDEAHTNWSGSRIAWIQYNESAENKREDNRELLNRWTAWRLGLFIADGVLDLSRYGKRLGDISWEWINKGVPWVDPLKEITGNVAAIAAGLASPERIAKEQGEDVYEIIDETARVMAYAAGKGVSLSFVPPVIPADPPPEPKNGKQSN